ncbi:ATP-binding protein [Caulobacter sp. NIBR1757]|uniref:ATP-binding protein n=1 Tax=Caulobacter sp. NIBR1757 TaxID=3016000 RepID=UPI0022F03908|nr:ATP-binding protein [Caulobacter sp. NIBR1757]WGM41258.1 Sensor histidine kinase RcsC [Caulobacter sp. NIBR1757]
MSASQKNRTPLPEADVARWFFENSRDLFCVATLDGVLLHVNAAWTAATGWLPEELIGQRPLELIHPDDRSGFIRSGVELSRTGESATIGRIRTKDGRWLCFDGRNRLCGDGKMISTMRDVTAEKAREEELAAARRDHTLLSEVAGIACWTYEPDTDALVWADDVAPLFGWQAEDLGTAAALNDKLDPLERDRVAGALAHAMQTGEGLTIEHRLRRVDGGWMTMRATVTTEPRGDRFALKGICCNVTELAEARDLALSGERRVTALAEELTANSIRLKMALEAAQAGAFEVDHVAQTFWASEQFHDLVECRMTYEEIRAPFWPFVHPADRDTVAAVTAQWASGDTSQDVEFRIVLEGRPERWARVYYTLDMETLRGVGLVIDIDDRKRQELALVEAKRAALAAADAKSRFLANMSHELRTPMNGVIGVLHLLEREALSEEGRRMLTEALDCGRMLTALIDDVVDFSRIEAGKLDLAHEPVDIGSLARGVVHMLAPQAREKDIALRLAGDETIGWAIGDGIRLRQALYNLVGNAVKFTLQGHVTVRCRRDGDRLTFEIEDTGVGIPLEAQAGLFQRFHQADASTTRQFGGSGLGLTITRRVAELMGGEVSFKSAPRLGSTFLLAVNAPATAPLDLVPAPVGEVLDGLRVLVVEDNATNRMIAVKLLETLGAQVGVACDGLDGVEAAVAGCYDLILMDIQMPGIDGMEATRRIRASGAPAAQAPILALTANVMSDQRQAYLAAGMDGVASKPLSPAALLAEIVRLSSDAAPRSAAA